MCKIKIKTGPTKPGLFLSSMAAIYAAIKRISNKKTDGKQSLSNDSSKDSL